MDGVEHVGAFVVASFSFLCKVCNFFGAFLFPEILIFSFEELTIFFEFSGFSIKNGINLV